MSSTVPVPERLVQMAAGAMSAEVHRECGDPPDLTYRGMARTALAPVLADLRAQVLVLESLVHVVVEGGELEPWVRRADVLALLDGEP